MSAVSDTKEGGGNAVPPFLHSKAARGISVAVRWWALAGGVLTLALAFMTAASALSNIFTGRPFAADYELVKHIIAVAIFMFLPYCQITGSNVTVDIFTEAMSETTKRAMAVFSSLFAMAFSLLLLVQMYGGLQSYLRFQEVTPVLKLPLWTAFPPILVSLFLLLLAACVTFAANVSALRMPRGETTP
ncbi:MAG: TRAP transporter small permease [Pseudorhizobium sp.]